MIFCLNVCIISVIGKYIELKEKCKHIIKELLFMLFLNFELHGDHPRSIPANFGSHWPNGFQGEDENMKR